MIDTSTFTYFPPLSFRPNYCFLGFSRDGKEDQITQECWRNIASMVEEKVVDRIRKEFHMYPCPSDVFSFAYDNTDVGIILTKLTHNVTTLFEIAKQKAEERKLPEQLEEPLKKVIQKAIDISSIPQDEKEIREKEKEIRQRKINEFAVKVLCEMSVEANVDKKHILNEIKKAKEDGYLLEKNYYDLQSTILKC